MPAISETAPPTPAPATTPISKSALFWVLGLAALLAVVYLPLVLWLGKTGFAVSQLSTGGVLVMFALGICLQDIIRHHAFQPNTSNYGFGLLGLALLLMVAALYLKAAALPLLLLSFCASFAGIVSFLFGKPGAQRVVPALATIFVFGLLAALVPRLDWPLRRLAAGYAETLIEALGMPVQLQLYIQQAPQLVLVLPGRAFVVATECNGFGLLASALLLAVFLAFQYRLSWANKLGLVFLAVPIAIGCNFFRIVSIALLAPRLDLPYAWIHETLGLVFYYAGLGLVWGVTRRQRIERPRD